MKRKGKIFIGTSGFHYQHWVGTYYPEKTKSKDFLKYFIKDFKTVELNNPFYHLPPKQTFENWRKQTPEKFLFSVKASRYITHRKKLNDCQEPLNYFLENANGLEEKLGPVLFQLPPHWEFNQERFESFLEILPQGYRYTFEFRDPSWYNETTINLLKKYNCAFCIYQLAGHSSPVEVTADFIYMRLHGPTNNKYQGSYPDKTLKQWASKIKDWSDEGKDTFAYFDNDEKGYAAFNALRLKELILKSKIPLKKSVLK